MTLSLWLLTAVFVAEAAGIVTSVALLQQARRDREVTFAHVDDDDQRRMLAHALTVSEWLRIVCYVTLMAATAGVTVAVAAAPPVAPVELVVARIANLLAVLALLGQSAVALRLRRRLLQHHRSRMPPR